MVFDRKRPREQWCCSKASCHHHPIANDKTHKKKIFKIRKIKKEGRKREKRWVKKGGVELYWQVHVMWNVVVDWQSVTYDTTYREREKTTYTNRITLILARQHFWILGICQLAIATMLNVKGQKFVGHWGKKSKDKYVYYIDFL